MNFGSFHLRRDRHALAPASHVPEAMRHLQALVANIAAVLSGKVVVAVAGMATMMVLARSLGPQDFGYYRTVFTYVAFAAVFGDLGLYMVSLREMSRPGADASRVFSTALPLRLTSSVCVLALASAIGWLFPYDRIVKWGIFIGAAIYTCIQASELLIAVFQSVRKQGRNAVAEASGALAALGAVGIMALLHKGPLHMLAAALLGSLIALAISWRLATRLVPLHYRINLRSWKVYLALGVPIAGSQILGMAMLRGDSLILSVFQPASAVGLYGISTKLFEVAASIPIMFGGLMMPALTTAASRVREDFPRVLGNSVDTAAIYGIAAILALAPFAPDVLDLIAGAKFAAGASALAVISIALCLSAVSQVLRFALVACERQRMVLMVDAVACTVAFCAYFGLIPAYSILGAAAGTVMAEGSSLIGMLVALKRAGLRLPSARTPAKALGAGLIAFGTMLFFDEFDTPWIVSLLLGESVYFGVLWLAHAIPPQLLDAIFRRRASLQRSARAG